MKRVSEIQKIKLRIQKLLLDKVRARDKGCVFAPYQITAGKCGGITTADHIITRQKNSTFADLDNIICVCFSHHFWFKPQNPTLYTDLVKKIIGLPRYRKIHQKGKELKLMTKENWLKVEEKLK